MLNTAHLYFSERGLDLDCTDVFFKTARISVPAPNKVRISYDYYKHKYLTLILSKFIEEMQIYVAGGFVNKYWVESSNSRVIYHRQPYCRTFFHNEGYL